VAALLPVIALSLRRRIGKLLAAESYDAVHAHWVLPNGWLAASPAVAHRIPLVVSLHGSDVALAERNGLFSRLARRAFSAAGAVTACSEDLHRRAVALGADPGSTVTVHYGVDTESFAPRASDPSQRARLGAPADGTLLVAAVGRLVEKKGFRYLIEAVARVDGVHLAIVGDGGLRSELERLAYSLNAPVSFTGDLDHSAVAVALAAVDIVAVPSVVDSLGNVDGLPNTLLEALSAGRPVVAAAIGGIPELVAHRINGLLVPEKDVDALARALTELKEPTLREQLGREARRRAVAELGWDATARALEAAFATARAELPGLGRS
jgi:glycosyltransferase involved in cell wall biosynthesis